jgi:hypothetical protein
MFDLNLTRITATSCEDPCTLGIVSRSILLRIRNVSDKLVQKIKKHIQYPIFFFFQISCLYETLCNTDRQRERERKQFACWKTKAFYTIAFQQQQWLRERASMLRYKYTACLVPHVTICCELLTYRMGASLVHHTYCLTSQAIPAWYCIFLHILHLF